MRPGTQDKILLATAALGLALVAAWAAWQQQQLDRQPQTVPEPQFTTTPYQPSETASPAVALATWTPPASRGAWSFDVFTPPEIYYNPRTREFTVTPPGEDPATVGEGGETSFGLDVIAVKQEAFRLQLVGFVGGEGDYAGAFQNVVTSEHFLARGGQRLPDLGVTIERFQVGRQRIVSPDAMTASELVATAEVRDDRTGATVTLTSRERRFTGDITAVVTFEGEQRVVHQGETLKSGPATYRIEKISLTPATVEVVREAPDLAEPDHRTLVPRPVEPPAAKL